MHMSSGWVRHIMVNMPENGKGYFMAHPENFEPFIIRIKDSNPNLAIERARYNPDALANDVIVINDDLVFRFPKDEAGRANLANEVKLLGIVRAHVSLPVPVLEQVEPDFIMYRWLPGEPLYRHRLLLLERKAQRKLAEQLAHFLTELHSIPYAVMLAAGLGERPNWDRNARWRKRYSEILHELYPLMWADQKAWVDHLFSPVLDGSLNLAAFEPAVIHNDLGSYHILFDPERNELSGILDFGLTGLGDPASDYAALISCYGESFLSQMAPFDPGIHAALERARFMAGAIEFDWVLPDFRAFDPGWFLVHLGRARDLRPFGTSLAETD